MIGLFDTWDIPVSEITTRTIIRIGSVYHVAFDTITTGSAMWRMFHN